MAVVGAPAYFESRAMPLTPDDLADHDCINLRLATAGGLYAWEFEKDGRELRVRVEGRLVFNSVEMILKAARSRFRPCLRAGGPYRQAADRRRAAGAGAGGLVPALRRLSPLLPQPTPTDAGLRGGGRGLAVPGVRP